MPNNANPTLVHRKIAVLGFRAVGKTSLTNAFVSGTFSDNYDPTIENTHHKTIRFRKVHFATDIIDTAGMVSAYLAMYIHTGGAGLDRPTSDTRPSRPWFIYVQDEYSSISRNASVGVHGYALVFSTTSRSSFENVIKINEALLNALGDASNVPRVLVGSMKDLPEEREVPLQQAQSLADNWGIPYLECSSKTGENVAEVFHTLLKEIEKDDGLLKENENEKCIIL